MKISEAIGLTITELRYFHSEKKNNNFFSSLLQLSNKKIIHIPVFPEAEILQKNKLRFFLSKRMSINNELVENQVIKDFYFKYDEIDNELCEWESGYIELENGYVITETSCTPIGLVADLSIMIKADFLNLKKEEEKDGFIIKSYLTEFQK